jgi:hypothetical protein
MPLHPDVVQRGVDFRGSRVVFHVSEMAVALLIIAMDMREVVFWELEDDGEEN